MSPACRDNSPQVRIADSSSRNAIQLFLRVHNETLSVAVMCLGNEDHVGPRESTAKRSLPVSIWHGPGHDRRMLTRPSVSTNIGAPRFGVRTSSMKSTSRSAFFNHSVSIVLVLSAIAASITAGTVLAFVHPEASAKDSNRRLTFEERVSYQRAIEDVYWRHRIWPKENPDPKPSLDAVMSQAQLENKVTGYLRDSLALQDYGQHPITAEQLQAEMDRMARDTKQPEVLRELFDALGNDPAVIAECLARPTLVERLIADLSAQDQTRHVESPQSDGLRAMSVVTTLGQVVYTLPEIADAGDPPCTDDSWTATTTANAPLGRYRHTAVWTGSEMIVWGGDSASGALNTGGRYNPSTDSWTATSTTSAPDARHFHTAVWTGNEMIVWGGDGSFDDEKNTGGRYNPSTDTWTATSTINAPSARQEHTAIWTGSEMVVWGGVDYPNFFNSGGRYNPSTNTWTATSTTNATAGRSGHTAVWTGSEMIVWGGSRDGTNGSSFLNTGGRYNPSTNSWSATTITGAPDARIFHTAVWTGSEMIVWGGYVIDQHGNRQRTNTGRKYNPSADSWIATIRFNAPTPRVSHTAVWTGSEMIVWGGSLGGPAPFNTGGRYQPSADSWRAASLTNAPTARFNHTAVWTGSEMIVWGEWETPAGDIARNRHRPRSPSSSRTAEKSGLPAASTKSSGKAILSTPAT
jgi:N-acetylneuraminic acid mutarotase